jgi:hypothetical protein
LTIKILTRHQAVAETKARKNHEDLSGVMEGPEIVYLPITHPLSPSKIIEWVFHFYKNRRASFQVRKGKAQSSQSLSRY